MEKWRIIEFTGEAGGNNPKFGGLPNLQEGEEKMEEKEEEESITECIRRDRKRRRMMIGLGITKFTWGAGAGGAGETMIGMENYQIYRRMSRREGRE